MPTHVLFLCLLTVGPLHAKTKPDAAKAPVSKTAEVDAALTRYRTAEAVQADIKKTVSQELMGTINESEGRFYFSKGKLRLDIDKPEKSILVYDGKSVWLESRLDDKHVQVSHMRAGALKRTDSLLAALFDRKDALKNYNLLRATEKNGQKTFAFEAKDKKNTEVRALEVGLAGKDIRRIMYKDQMENTVNFDFSNVVKGAVPAQKFKYQPPAGATVTEL